MGLNACDLCKKLVVLLRGCGMEEREEKRRSEETEEAKKRPRDDMSAEDMGISWR